MFMLNQRRRRPGLGPIFSGLNPAVCPKMFGSDLGMIYPNRYFSVGVSSRVDLKNTSSGRNYPSLLITLLELRKIGVCCNRLWIWVEVTAFAALQLTWNLWLSTRFMSHMRVRRELTWLLRLRTIVCPTPG